MAASAALRRNVLSLPRILTRISHLSPRGCAAASLSHRTSNRLQTLASCSTHFHTSTASLSEPTITVTEEPDTLFQKVSVLVKGHDKSVLDSFEFFATIAAQELGIALGKIFEPPKDIDRLTLLKSVHIFKKHRVQYEMRTHYRCIELNRVTGSTAHVYLEYIQRNLPEGVAMEVTKTAMEKIPDHILEPIWNAHPIEEKPSQ
ncbi:small ribosomal subunit protein uS10m [Eucyclogobius newberryi]|uniref:small ribosomal subunit protein uS10m n=1 Tax=Eucyclogobius newberryi TaxID=166745 RepID=UPI003B5CBB8A